ncbi:peptidase C39 family protein [Streptomyces sp. B1866]|uniref:peptidase C39 family protein n=1 Tax=Streptomyces sp. B1866 TaxID=3075431 RepID=UPI002891A0A7|nr:peptidase C39 family protein [Streptomyces sp. B1866]MDT3398482.1 peptidase C39 family protein [Streptomyces sp. B1866]
MTRSVRPPRRTLLAAALGAAVAATAAPAGAATRPPRKPPGSPVDYHGWSTYADWHRGAGAGVRAEGGPRPGVRLARPVGAVDYTDPHTGTTASWDYGTWTSPEHTLRVPATEAIASWSARTPPGTWIQVELRAAYTDGTDSPWYVLGRWTSDDSGAAVRRTSVDGQGDGKTAVSTDTVAVDAPATGLRMVSYRLRLTLYRRRGGTATPTVWRVGAMGSDIPDRFEVPASAPGAGAGRELLVPRYSQDIHDGQYPQYDGGGEAWCSPASSQMVIEYWGRRPSAEDLAWVDPGYADPQVCHAARQTYDYQYKGCGNWPFNAAYAATYHGLQGVVTRLGSLRDAERLVAAGIPLITSQSFLKEELDGAGYGTSGHLMTVIGFTADGDVIANDPASPDNAAVRRVYKRRQWENIWLRTKRRNAQGAVVSGTGGVCYLYFPAKLSVAQKHALASVGVR